MALDPTAIDEHTNERGLRSNGAPCTPDSPTDAVVTAADESLIGGGGGDDGKADILASSYRRCPQGADELGATSIAFPSIATGVHDQPSEEAARIAASALRTSQSPVRQIRLVACGRAALGPQPGTRHGGCVSRAPAGPRRPGDRRARPARTGA
ncbi:macro domain-containing protein [Streptomyces sp. PA03-5A]|nr:macro domain-containing protein [Streptomyces sp. PA03-5A]